MISVFVITGEISEDTKNLIKEDFDKFTPDLFKNSKSKISIADFTSKEDALAFLRSYQSKIDTIAIPDGKKHYILDVFGAEISKGQYMWSPFAPCQ